LVAGTAANPALRRQGFVRMAPPAPTTTNLSPVHAASWAPETGGSVSDIQVSPPSEEMRMISLVGIVGGTRDIPTVKFSIRFNSEKWGTPEAAVQTSPSDDFKTWKAGGEFSPPEAINH